MRLIGCLPDWWQMLPKESLFYVQILGSTTWLTPARTKNRSAKWFSVFEIEIL